MKNSKLLNGSLIERNHMHIILKSDSGFNLPLGSPQMDVLAFRLMWDSLHHHSFHCGLEQLLRDNFNV